ncbi:MULTISPECIES: DUF6203 family protein [Microbispora]|uniref:PEP-CTERM sorting domain-containing protein n=1 Tax=Microbispora siamensis TaxID=564413 RepID=A0ABQ4GL19_9ACTN|nr:MULTISPECIES: DUF6203 family protein [Microbispora]OPG11204.1 hypothetical protein B1L11_21575 [Microbispora sp. GKU 823]GIH62118.1 hypothetical protein Msi02_29350 [Microbispora siamensis]
MKRILQLVVTRWLARTPIGMVVLGLAWLFMRKRRARRQQPADSPVLREPGRRSGNPYAWRGPAAGNRR